MSLVWFGFCLAGTNRIPFDFAEEEGEFVSEFNLIEEEVLC